MRNYHLTATYTDHTRIIPLNMH